MIPRQLTLRNFLSYRSATLDFRGLHVACVSGANGAGKSSLLEAIAWVIWGQSRVAAEDDVVHLGALEAQVDFVFEHQGQTYRVIRVRRRGQGGNLEFQVQTEQGFRPLTQRGMRATQALICDTLRLDYDTFINSAYLRQGRADEFMLKRPSDRKQILADLLKLSQYDQLAERAKDEARDAKAEAAVLESAVDRLAEQITHRGTIAAESDAIAAQLADLQTQQAQCAEALTRYQQTQQRRDTLNQRCTLVSQQQQLLGEQRDRLQAQIATITQRQQDYAAILAEADNLEAQQQRRQTLQAEEEKLAIISAQVQQLQAQRQTLQQQQDAAVQTIQQQQQRATLKRAALAQQQQELQPILEKQAAIATALSDLQAARDRLHHFEQLQLQVSPLIQRRQTLQRQLDRAQAQLAARLDTVIQSESHLQQQQAQHPQLQQAVMEIGHTLAQLEARRAYQEQVREKGLERRRFMDRLQDQQRACEAQMGQIEQKLQLLKQPDALCPLCDRPLDADHWELVLARHAEEHDALQKEIWVIREQLAVSEREIQVLRQEYRDLEDELARYGPVLERRGQLQAQLSTSADVQHQLQALAQERDHLERCLREHRYATDIQAEMSQLDAAIAALAYDERDHALARGKVDRLRWAEIKQAELQNAQRKHARLAAQIPELDAHIAALEQALTDLAHSDRRQHIHALEAQIAALDYRLDHHQAVREALREAQTTAPRYAALQQAREEWPHLETHLSQLQAEQQHLQQQQAEIQAQLDALQAELTAIADPQPEIARLTQLRQTLQQQRDTALARSGALQQQLLQFDSLQRQLDDQRQTLHHLRHRQRVYQELAQAFGRNGLQALLIETVLPQLEAETNQILGRLSAHQLHVQFVTQKSGRSRQSKLIDTLDILIADAQGTRPYETYSGGEAFRVNFAIRLALARLLAQRSGTPLQLLIIDEGFGTQDQEGCDRLIAAINAIAPDFACILAVTHIPHFREAFQTRIDVEKTADGSRLALSL